jgi:hypothetical protein
MQVAHDCALVGHLPSIPFFARYHRTDGADVSEKQSGRANVCPQFCRTVDDTKKWGKEKENAMRKSLLVPALALGVALSGSAFGHSWSAKMTGQSYSANSPSSKPARSAKMSAQLNSGKSSSSNAVNRVEMSGGPHGD